MATGSSGPRREPGRRIPEQRLWQVGFVVGSAIGAAVTVAGRQLERIRARGRSRRLGPRRGDRDRAAAPGAGHAVPRPSCARRRRAYDAAMALVVPALGAPSGRSCRASSSGTRSSIGRPGCAPTCRHVRRADRPARGATCSTRSCPSGSGARKAAMAMANRFVTTRQIGCCSGSWASGSSASTTSRCCPPRRRPAGCCSSRRTSARPRQPGRAARGRSGPGSRCTRRPTPSSSRLTRGCGRTSPSASSGRSRSSATGRRR